MFAHMPRIGREISLLIALHLSVPGSHFLAPFVLVTGSAGVNTICVMRLRLWRASSPKLQLIFNFVVKVYKMRLSFVLTLSFHPRLGQNLD